MSDAQVTGRLAPSPTGSLHLGHAMSFIAAWMSARHQGGRVILRLEDVDADRAADEHARSAIEDLKWLGLDWDGEPITQSTRTERLRAAAEELAEQGLAFPCVCTRSELARAQAEEASGAPQGRGERPYPGTCRARFSGWREAEGTTGCEAGLRFKVIPGEIRFIDAVFGEIACDVSKQVGDFLILRRNKIPAYQLAIVLDDAEDGVTEVVRGRDLLDSTARQILLARSLGVSVPSYVHVPLVCDPTGKRLAKRDGARSLHELRQAGVTPKAIHSWAARALGQPDTGGDTLRGIEQFDVSKIPRQDIVLPRDFREIF